VSRILAIEDSAAIRLLLTRRLGRSGHEVEALGSPSEAVRMLKGRAPPEQPEVILLDLGLPGEDGIGAIPEISRASPGTPVILVSARHDLDLLEPAADVAGRVAKPIDFAKLLGLIEKLTG